jgi:hypothetical protein
MAAGVPRQGGATWVVLQFVLGLRRLGHEVLLVEEVDDLNRCAPYFAALVRGFGLDGALLERSTGRVMGVPRSRLLGARSALNISGALRDERLLKAPTCACSSPSIRPSPSSGTRWRHRLRP